MYLNSFCHIWNGRQSKTIATSPANGVALHLHEKKIIRFSTRKHFCFYSTKKHFISRWCFPKKPWDWGSCSEAMTKVKKSWDPQQVTAESWAWTTWGVEEQLLISSSCLLIFLDESKSFKLINFCLNLNRPMEATKAQHVFIAGTFGNDRFTTIVVWYRALSCDPTNYESRLSWGWHLRIAVPITTRTLRFA